MQPTTVAIIGGGPAGLCAARILHQHGIRVTVYEGESSRTARSQGGSLDLHAATGQRALAEANLTQKFKAKVQTGADAVAIMDHEGTVLYSDNGDGDKARPEIERSDLRTLLLDSLEPGTVVWGHRLESVAEPVKENGPIQLKFVGGMVAEADLVIGADGAWSKVRPVLTSVKPEYSGVTILDINLPSDFDYPSLQLSKGMLIAKGNDSHCLFAHLGAVPHAYLGVRTDDPKQVTPELAAQLVHSWSENLQKVTLTSAEQGVVRPIVALPHDLKWNRDYTEMPSDLWKARVAIIGDAAHVAPPNGDGANLALADAADLSKALIAAVNASANGATLYSQLGTAIATFEKRNMWRRASRAGLESKEFMVLFYGEGGAQRVADWMRSQFTVMNMIRKGVGAVEDLVMGFF
ncbi:hypothetical protein HDU98_006287 [Podochytrium sp. JEL0797]|nr:hypothetical protein HDU98_006287 [Podochytrium sp. JEL0797]